MLPHDIVILDHLLWIQFLIDNLPQKLLHILDFLGLHEFIGLALGKIQEQILYYFVHLLKLVLGSLAEHAVVYI